MKRVKKLEKEIIWLNGRIRRLHQFSERLSSWRLALFVLGGVMTAITLLLSWSGWLTLVVAVAFVVGFTAVVVYHRRIDVSLTQHQIWRTIKSTHVARLQLDWQALPPPLPIPNDLADHPFAHDLDLIGARSVQQLLDTAVSQEGSQRLRQWLLDVAPDFEATQQRQARVEALRGQDRFRDKLTLNGLLMVTQPGEKWPGQQLLNWLAAPSESHFAAWVLPSLFTLAALNIVLAGVDAIIGLPSWWLGSWLLFLLLSVMQLRQVPKLFEDAWFLETSLGRLQQLFDFLEQQNYKRMPQIEALCQPLLVETERPSQQLRRVSRVLAGAGLRQNQLVWIAVNAIVPWDIYFAYRMQQARQSLAQQLPRWLNVWFELEALNSLATYANLHPDAIFPEIVTDDGTLFCGEGLAHPLILPEQRVPNNFTVSELGTIAIITGSNMAGKSSFLRTLGVHLVLAYAGGAVPAQALQITAFRLFSSIRVGDSLADGFSFFYAEVRRLQRLLTAWQDEGEKRPLFCLIDEIFRGTNNRERLLGSQAYVRALMGGNGVGVIATHDLELVKLADSNPSIVNYHFRDDVQDGRMIFDYQLRPGPCPTTNALKIMRLAGLPVEM